MRQPVLLDNSGFTLLEIMVAFVILTIGLLGLLETVNVSIMHNMSNKLRSDAVMVADQVMMADRAGNFADLATGSWLKKSGVSGVEYTVTRTVTPQVPGMSSTGSLTVTVAWLEKGRQKQHSLTTLIRN